MPRPSSQPRRTAKSVAAPLQQVLRAPLTLHGGVAHEAVAFEMDEGWKEPQCAAWLTVKNSARLRSWRSTLRKQVKADQSWRDSEHYSRLGGSGIAAIAQPTLGVLQAPDGDEDADDPGRTVYATLDMGAILMDESEAPIGYATFRTVWLASGGAMPSNDLEVEVGEVWIAPTRRGEGLSHLLAAAVVDGVWRHLAKLNTGLESLTAQEVRFDLVYAGDVYSQSGADFIARCAQWHGDWVVSLGGTRGDRLVEQSLKFEARW